jgi:Big-like domain-containing protein
MKPLCALVVLLAAASSGSAATKTWSGAGSTGVGQWSLGANWVGGIAPVAGDDLVFPQPVSSSSSNNDLPAGMTFASINVTRFHWMSGNAIQTSGLTIGPSPAYLFASIPISGPVVVQDGGLLMYGNQFNGPVTGSNATLQLHGTSSIGAAVLTGSRLVLGTVIDNGGSYFFSNSNAASLSLDSSSGVSIALSPAQSSKITVNGPVVLGNATLAYMFHPFDVFPAGTEIRIIDNTSASPVSGIFAGLPEGATLGATVGQSSDRPQKFKISYVGGTGNDVILIPQPVATSNTTLTVAPAPWLRNQPFTLTATVQTTNGPATGSVQFIIGPGNEGPWTCTATLNSQGVATCTAPGGSGPLPPFSTINIQAVWPGTSTIVGSQSAIQSYSFAAEVPALDMRALALLAIALTAISIARLSIGR